MCVPISAGKLAGACKELPPVIVGNITMVTELIEAKVKAWDTHGDSYIEWLEGVTSVDSVQRQEAFQYMTLASTAEGAVA